MTRIRSAKASDAAAITALWNAMIRDTLATFTTIEKTVPEIVDLIRTRAGAFWIAEAPQIKGFATFGSFRSGPGYAATVEHTVIVAPSAHRSGTGTALMDVLETGAAAKGAHVLVAGISSANPNAMAFHAARGFVETARMPEVGRKADQWLDLILMQKTVSAA